MTSTRTYTNAYVTDARHQHEMSLPFRHFAVSPFRLSAAHQYTTSFGEPLSIKGAVDTDRARTGFIGRETDAEHNLGAFGARLYSSEYGRFLAVDKLWEKYRTLQPYQYAGNSPVMAVDVDGRVIIPINLTTEQYAEFARAIATLKKLDDPFIRQVVDYAESQGSRIHLYSMPGSKDVESATRSLFGYTGSIETY